MHDHAIGYTGGSRVCIARMATAIIHVLFITVHIAVIVTPQFNRHGYVPATILVTAYVAQCMSHDSTHDVYRKCCAPTNWVILPSTQRNYDNVYMWRGSAVTRWSRSTKLLYAGPN